MNEPIVISTADAEGLTKYFAAKAKDLLDKGVKIEVTAKLNPDIIPVGVFVNAALERVEELLLDGTIHEAVQYG